MWVTFTHPAARATQEIKSQLKVSKPPLELNTAKPDRQFCENKHLTYSSESRGARGASGARESGFAISSIWALRTL